MTTGVVLLVFGSMFFTVLVAISLVAFSHVAARKS